MATKEVQSAFLETKSFAFIGEVNRELLRQPKARTFPKERIVAEAMLGMYMEYVLSLEDSETKDEAVRYGWYVIESFQVPRKYDEPSVEHEGLPMRKKRIDTTSIRATVVKTTARLVGDARREVDERTVVIRSRGRFGPEVLGLKNPDGSVTRLTQE